MQWQSLDVCRDTCGILFIDRNAHYTLKQNIMYRHIKLHEILRTLHCVHIVKDTQIGIAKIVTTNDIKGIMANKQTINTSHCFAFVQMKIVFESSSQLVCGVIKATTAMNTMS